MPLFGPPNIEKLREKGDVKGLVKALRHKDVAVREGAIAALEEFGDAVVEPITNALYSQFPARLAGDDASERDKAFWAAAVEALKRETHTAVPHLIDALKDKDPKAPGGVVLADALNEIGGAEAERAADEYFAKVQIAAVEFFMEAIWAHAQEALDSGYQEDAEPGKAAFLQLQEMGTRGVDALIAIMQDHRRIPGQRNAAAATLGLLKDRRAVDALIGALQGDDSAVRWAAADTLGRLGDVKAVGSLALALSDRNEDVRTAAAEALERIGGPEAERALAGHHHK